MEMGEENSLRLLLLKGFYEAINMRRDTSEMGKRHWKLKKE